ncbi:MAG: C40 family peptidase [Niabella sp.]
MQYAIVTAAAAPVRLKPNHRAEMSNQLLFGEAVKIVRHKKHFWYKVQSLYDGYEGWVTHHMILGVTQQEADRPVAFLAADLLNKVETPGGIIHVPRGAFLFGLNGNAGGVDAFPYKYKGAKVVFKKENTERVVAVAKEYLNAPYAWGGKTILGIDCSGFAQTVYKMSGMPILRDARQQAGQGKLIKKLKNAKAGDLAFFDDKEEIVHVGILLGPDKIIHSAGKVRIDDIDEQGIVNVDTGKRTHSLKLIKRFF